MSLSEITKIQYGFSFDGSLFNSKALGFPIVRIRDIPNGFSNDYTTETADSKYIVKSGDILVGMDGEFHINTWCGKDAFLVQRVCKISPKDPILAGYLFQAIYEPIKYFEKTIIGATVSHLGKKHLDSIQIICPDISLQSPLNEMFKLRQKLLEQNMALKVIRDLLLPRLMSGKLGVLNIEVHGLEKQIAENMKELW